MKNQPPTVEIDPPLLRVMANRNFVPKVSYIDCERVENIKLLSSLMDRANYKNHNQVYGYVYLQEDQVIRIYLLA